MVTPVPSRADDTIRRATGAIGGPLGRYAAEQPRWWTPVRILLAIAAITFLLGYAEKSPCASGNWVNSKQYTHACYSDVVPLWDAEGLANGAVPYRDHAVEYPVMTGAFMWASAEITRGYHALVGDGAGGSNELLVFGVVTCILLALSGLVAVAATAGAAGQRRRWDAAIFAAAPLLIFHAFSNWDLFAMAFASGALWAWARNRPIAAGVLIGLGTAAKLYPVFLLFPLVLLAYRSRIWRPVLWAIAAAAGSWLAVNLPAAIAWNKGWWEFYSFSESRPAEASTFWAMLNHVAPGTFSTPSGGWVPPGWAVALALVVALVLVGWVALRVPARPRVAQLAFLTVAAFLLTTKVWSPQYSIWLVPLLALARPRWRMAIVWQASEIAVWIGTLLWLLAGTSTFNQTHSLTYGGLAALLLFRDAVLLTLIGCIVYEMHHPERDVVRSAAEPDPGAGPFALPAPVEHPDLEPA